MHVYLLKSKKKTYNNLVVLPLLLILLFWCTSLLGLGLKIWMPGLTLCQGCVFTSNINRAMIISDAMETGTVQINSAPARGPDHFPFQVYTIIIKVASEKTSIYNCQHDQHFFMIILLTHISFPLQLSIRPNILVFLFLVYDFR